MKSYEFYIELNKFHFETIFPKALQESESKKYVYINGLNDMHIIKIFRDNDIIVCNNLFEVLLKILITNGKKSVYFNTVSNIYDSLIFLLILFFRNITIEILIHDLDLIIKYPNQRFRSIKKTLNVNFLQQVFFKIMLKRASRLYVLNETIKKNLQQNTNLDISILYTDKLNQLVDLHAQSPLSGEFYVVLGDINYKIRNYKHLFSKENKSTAIIFLCNATKRDGKNFQEEATRRGFNKFIFFETRVSEQEFFTHIKFSRAIIDIAKQGRFGNKKCSASEHIARAFSKELIKM